MEFESAHSNTTTKLPILKLAQENGTSITKMSVPVTAKEKTNKKNDVKARSLLLMALPNEHQLTFSQYNDAKTMFAAIETRFGGNEATNKTQKTLLKQQYEIFSVVISQEDLNSKFLSSLPPEWNTHVVVWMNKAEIETMSIDDLYNNFKIVEQKVKKFVGASSGAQNLSFITAPIRTASFSDNVVYAFMVENPNGSNLLQQDLEKIHDHDLKAMDLKWQLSLLSMRAKGYYQRTGKKIFINVNDTAGYDKSKVECFNYHKMGHFASECRAPRNKEGFDWSDMAEEQVQKNVALMVFSDSESKFDGKSDKGFFVGYSLSSKAFRVYNTRTRRVEANFHIGLLENKPIIEGNGPKWLFDINSLTQSMNYVPVTAGTIINESVGTQGELNAGTSKEISQDCIVMPIWKDASYFDLPTKDVDNGEPKSVADDHSRRKMEYLSVRINISMIGSLMYLTASRPDIMFAVCACARFQVTPKTSHLLAVKRIFRYLKGKPTLGLWKSTTGGCQFLGNRLISWQCKKQIVVATSTTKAEYVAAASCCGQVLWIQNQLLDYGYNFMHTVINIDNNNLLTKGFDAGRHVKRGRDTKIPQSSSPPVKVGDEAVHKESDDRMERAATTTSILEVEQDSGSGPRCQDTILGVVDAQTRFETTSKQSNNPPLSRGYTLGSGEDKKPAESDGFHEIIDFLNANRISYALTVNSIIYTSCIQQFWAMAKANTVNGEHQLQALIDKKKVIITESNI
ncbi:ribonuclease H-like domain-containing protein [Tanacetum coccineum]